MTDIREYGRALFLIAEEEGATERVYSELSSVFAALNDNPKYAKLLDTPAITPDERAGLIKEAFGKFNENLVNLLMLLSDKHLIYRFADVNTEYTRLYDEKCGIERAVAISATPLSSTQLSRLGAKLGAMTGKRVIIKNEIDTYLLGGMKLRYLGRQLDGTVKARLDSFEKSLQNLTI